MFNLTETEKAYLAGLFDGEGTVGYYLKSSGYHFPQVAIYNSDPLIMDWISARISGGCVASNSGKNSRHRSWMWCHAKKSQIKQFLQIIRPFLVIKAEQVDLLLSLWDAEQKIRGKANKVSSTVLDLRINTEKELKRLKTAHYTRIPLNSIPDSGIDPYADLTRDT